MKNIVVLTSTLLSLGLLVGFSAPTVAQEAESPTEQETLEETDPGQEPEGAASDDENTGNTQDTEEEESTTTSETTDEISEAMVVSVEETSVLPGYSLIVVSDSERKYSTFYSQGMPELEEEATVYILGDSLYSDSEGQTSIGQNYEAASEEYFGARATRLEQIGSQTQTTQTEMQQQTTYEQQPTYQQPTYQQPTTTEAQPAPTTTYEEQEPVRALW